MCVCVCVCVNVCSLQVLSLVPTAPVSLMQLVSTHMPHKLRDRDTQCMFLSAVFRLAEAPAGRPVRDALLATVVEHLLTLDVDIRWEDISDKNHTGERHTHTHTHRDARARTHTWPLSALVSSFRTPSDAAAMQ